MNKPKVSDEIRLAIYLAGKRGVHPKALAYDFGVSRATVRSCMKNETRIRAIAPDALNIWRDMR